MSDYTPHQLANARIAIAVGKQRGISPRGQIGGISCGLVETNLRNLSNPKDPPSMNPKYGAVGQGFDSLSSGVLQQQPGKTWDAQPSWWGTVDCRMTPTCAYGQFYDRLLKQPYNDLNVSMGTFVQRVQGSSFPTRYDERMGEAQALYDRLFLEGAGIIPPGAPAVVGRPAFVERQMFGFGASPRSRTPINFLFHTEEGNSSAEGLARYCDGSHDVSYHYTVRDGIVYDVVDTDLYSWSVLAANAFTINLCFAGSRAGWSRAQWLQRERDIEIGCYLAVQDCRKYGFSTNVIVPPYVNSPGIADHKYVTEELHIGTHTDCGPNFPWDKVIQYVNLYAGEMETDDMFTDHDSFLLQTLAEKLVASRSALRHLGEGAKFTLPDLDANADGHGHEVRVVTEAKAGYRPSLDLLDEVADADPTEHPDRAEDIELAQLLRADVKAYRKLVHGDDDAKVGA